MILAYAQVPAIQSKLQTRKFKSITVESKESEN